MLLLITCRYLEVADRRMTTAIKLVLAHAFVSGATSFMYQFMRNRVIHRRSVSGARSGHAASSSWLAASSGMFSSSRILIPHALSRGGFGTLGTQGTCVTRRSRKLGMLAGDHGDALAYLPSCFEQSTPYNPLGSLGL